MSSAAVTTEQRDGVLICHIDDGKANALSAEIIAAISEVVAAAEAGRIGRRRRAPRSTRQVQRRVRPVGDDGRRPRRDDLARRRRRGARAHAVRVVDPRRRGVHRSCAGRGALVLLGCDVRVGADVDCKIGLNEVAIGMVLPDWAFTIAVERLEPPAPPACGGHRADHLRRRRRRCRLPRRGRAGRLRARRRGRAARRVRRR